MIHTPTHPDQGIFNKYFQSPVSHSQAEKLTNWQNEKKEANWNKNVNKRLEAAPA